MLLDYICEDCAHMPGITIVPPLYSDLESSVQVTVGEFEKVFQIEKMIGSNGYNHR